MTITVTPEEAAKQYVDITSNGDVVIETLNEGTEIVNVQSKDDVD